MSITETAAKARTESPPPGPATLAPIFENIPDKLKARPQWVVWKWELRDGKWTKPPVSPNSGRYAEADNPTTWATFGQAVTAYESGQWAGVGYVFTEDDPYTGFDLDDCLDGDTLTPEAAEWVRKFETYTEVSPSNTGIKGICEAKAAHNGNNQKEGAEIYDRTRYFTLTGHQLNGSGPAPIAKRQGVVNEFIVRYFPGAMKPKPDPKKKQTKTDDSTKTNGATWPTIDDRLEKAFNAKNGAAVVALFKGDISAYKSDDSAADMALCDYFSFYSDGDAQTLDAMFRKSKLLRAKWDEKHYSDGRTYGEETVAKALEGKEKFYEWKKQQFTWTPFGNSERLIQKYGDKLAYSYKAKAWLFYDDRRWKLDAQADVERIGKTLIREIHREALQQQAKAIEAGDADGAQKFLRFALQCQSTEGLNGMLKLAQSDVAREVETFDADPWTLNVENGLLNLKTFQLEPHSPKHYAARLAPVAYDPDAKCPLWLEFLGVIFKNNEAIIKYVQKSAGYSLTGDTSEHCLFIAYGTGRNGKGTLLGTLDHLIGDYAATVQSETLMTMSNDSRGPREDLARLCGARFVSATEAEDGKRFAESLVKQLTGGDKITACFKYGKLFEFKPAFKIWLACNHRPQIRGVDEGIWSRIRLIPFEVTIPKEKRDKTLPAKLAAELPGILNWCIEGLRLKDKEGFEPPDEVINATEGYRGDMDAIGRYLDERTVCSKHVSVQSSELYKDYAGWVEAEGEYKLSQTAFSNRLMDRGFQKRKDGVVKWFGLGLLAREEEGADGDIPKF